MIVFEERTKTLEYPGKTSPTKVENPQQQTELRHPGFKPDLTLVVGESSNQCVKLQLPNLMISFHQQTTLENSS